MAGCSLQITFWCFHDASTDGDPHQISGTRKALKAVYFQGLVFDCGDPQPTIPTQPQSERSVLYSLALARVVDCSAGNCTVPIARGAADSQTCRLTAVRKRPKRISQLGRGYVMFNR